MTLCYCSGEYCGKNGILQSGIRDLGFGIWDMGYGIWDLCLYLCLSEFPDPTSQVPDPRSWIPNPRSQIPDPRSSTPDPTSKIPNTRSQIPDPYIFGNNDIHSLARFCLKVTCVQEWGPTEMLGSAVLGAENGDVAVIDGISCQGIAYH